MLDIHQLPIYKSLANEVEAYRQRMIADLHKLGFTLPDNISSSDVSEYHFENVEKVGHPDASKHWIVINARMNMLNFAYDDLKKAKRNTQDVLGTIHEVEGLEKRDAIQRARRHAKELKDDDKMAIYKR